MLISKAVFGTTPQYILLVSFDLRPLSFFPGILEYCGHLNLVMGSIVLYFRVMVMDAAVMTR